MINHSSVITQVIQVLDLLQPVRSVYDGTEDMGNIQVVVGVEVQGLTQNEKGKAVDFQADVTAYVITHRDYDSSGALRDVVISTIGNALSSNAPSAFSIAGYTCDAIITPQKGSVSNFNDNYTMSDITWQLIYQPASS